MGQEDPQTHNWTGGRGKWGKGMERYGTKTKKAAMIRGGCGLKTAADGEYLQKLRVRAVAHEGEPWCGREAGEAAACEDQSWSNLLLKNLSPRYRPMWEKNLKSCILWEATEDQFGEYCIPWIPHSGAEAESDCKGAAETKYNELTAAAPIPHSFALLRRR